MTTASDGIGRVTRLLLYAGTIALGVMMLSTTADVILRAALDMPIRGVVAALMINRAGVYPVEILDGIAAGLQTVVVPGLVARVLHRSGRVNAGQGAVMTIQGLGGALSPLIGGWLAQEIGYFTTFMILGAFALGSVALWLGFASDLRPACEKWGSPARRGERPAMATG